MKKSLILRIFVVITILILLLLIIFSFNQGNKELTEEKKETIQENIEKSNVLKDVEYNLSKDNRYKPIVLFETINLDQVNISKASGYNLKFIIENGIGIGSKIEVIRSGQVIPKIINVIEKTEPKLPSLICIIFCF